MHSTYIPYALVNWHSDSLMQITERGGKINFKKSPFNKVDFLDSAPMGNLSKNVEGLSI